MSLTTVYQRLINNSALTALVSADDIYNRFLPDSATGPAVSFFLVSAPPINNLSGEATAKNYNYQFDVWADRVLVAEQIAEALKSALANGEDFKSVRRSQEYDYEDLEGLHRITIEFSLWF